MNRIGRILPALLLTLAAFLTSSQVSSAAARHVIVMVADGSGFNTWNATSMYQGRWDQAAGRSRQIYDAPGWIKIAASTYPLTTAKAPTLSGQQDPDVVYRPQMAWDKASGYQWLKANYTDSAAAATALSTSVKTFNNAINWSDLDSIITPTLTEAAKARWMSAGVVTSVEWSHATPAGFSNAHVAERDEYEAIARQMVEGGVLDVIMGAGHPDFDNDGKPRATRSCKYVGGEAMWKAIEAARGRPQGTYCGYRPVSSKAEFEALLHGPAPRKVLGTAQAGTTLQQARGTASHVPDDPAADKPRNANVPSLATMTQGALRVLGQNPKGFFLMVEGGAVDWANHANQPGRMLQEFGDYVAAVEAVVRWVEANSNWEETLLVLTADHETGLLWGPCSDKQPFQPIEDRGSGKLPGLKYNSRNHTNSLVPVYARGAGAERLLQAVAGTDPCRGPYVDNTTVSKTLWAALDAQPPAATPLVKPRQPKTLAADKDRCVILVSVDGLAQFYFDDAQAQMPTLHRLAREGAVASKGMVCAFPTVTWPNHVSMATGATPATHGVIGNNYFDRETRKSVQLILDPLFDQDQVVKVPMIHDVVHKAGFKTGGICWPCTRNAKGMDRMVPDMAPIEDWEQHGTKAWVEELRKARFPVDRHEPWCKDASGGVQRDWMYTRMLDQLLQKHGTNLVLIHLVEPDHVQHRFGPRSPESYWCASYADDRIRDIVESVSRSPFAGKATIFVCGDHGFMPIGKDIRPNVTLRKLGLIELSGGKVARQDAWCLSQGGACGVYVLDDARRAQIVAQLKKALAEIEGVDAVLGPEEFSKLGQPTRENDPRGADLWLSAKKDYSFSESTSGEEPVVARSAVGGTHGYLPDQPDLLSACVVWGADVKKGTDLGKVKILDVAPTIAKLFGLAMPTAEGKALKIDK